MEELTEFQKGQIFGARLGGMSVAKTAKLLNVTKDTVNKVMAECCNHELSQAMRASSESESKLTDEDRRAIKELVKENRTITASEITVELNRKRSQPLSIQAVRRELQKSHSESQEESQVAGGSSTDAQDRDSD